MVSRGLESLLCVFGVGEKDPKSQRNNCYLHDIKWAGESQRNELVRVPEDFYRREKILTVKF